MLPLQNFSSLISGMAAAVQGSCAQLLDLTVGSVLRAVLEANASIALWMQWLIMLVLQTTRAATSIGPDLDSWVADFGVTRLPGVAASGYVTFSRWTPTLAALVPLGALVRTADGLVVFEVIEDFTNSAWSGLQSGYMIGPGVSSVTVPLVSQTVGVINNVQAGTVTLIATAIPGVDTVTNATAFSGGLDAESDAALRARFGLFMDSRSRATAIAIQNAILSVEQGLVWSLVENRDPSGGSRAGFFTVILDNGTGSPPQSLLQDVSSAINLVRPVGTAFAVVPPQIQTVTVALSLGIAAGAPTSVVQGNVVSAITTYVDSMTIGGGLPASRLIQVAYDADPGVVNVSGLLLNGVPGDISVGASSLLRSGSVTVS